MTTPRSSQSEFKKLHFFIIDDDKESIEIYTRLLTKVGHKVTSTTSSKDAVPRIVDLQPDCVLCDLMMPDLDGFEVYKKLQEVPDFIKPLFIIVTSKLFDFDRRQALELGIDGYINKPVNPDTFVNELTNILLEAISIQFWGVRGSLPVPGKKTVRYGGNTNCVTLTFGTKHFFIFDAGTGIKELSNYLVKHNKLPISAKIFITHPHYDHVQGIPFFAPLYMKGNEFEIFGVSQGEASIEKQISDLMDNVYFPVTTNEFAAKLTFRDLKEEEFFVDELYVKTIFLNHPGRCLGYRVQYRNKSFCYITDNELYLEDSPHYNKHEVDRLIEFVKDTDMLVMDATYSDEEYAQKVGWGHSCISRVVDIADKANAKVLCLYHHDPDQFDKKIDAKLAHAKALLKARNSSTRCIAPHEGVKLAI